MCTVLLLRRHHQRPPGIPHACQLSHTQNGEEPIIKTHRNFANQLYGGLTQWQRDHLHQVTQAPSLVCAYPAPQKAAERTLSDTLPGALIPEVLREACTTIEALRAKISSGSATPLNDEEAVKLMRARITLREVPPPFPLFLAQVCVTPFVYSYFCAPSFLLPTLKAPPVPHSPQACIILENDGCPLAAAYALMSAVCFVEQAKILIYLVT
jgi:hypothetical protein